MVGEAGRDVTRALLDEAADDEAVARKLRGDAGVGDDVVGFHAQQAAEKLLKALLAARGAEYDHTHDLGRLLNRVAALGIDVPARFGALEALTPFAVRYRYEDGGAAEALDRGRALRLIADLRRWVNGQLDDPPSGS